MNSIFFINNWLGWQVLKWMVGRGNSIMAVVIHPENNRKFGDEILTEVEKLDIEVIRADHLEQSETLAHIERLCPEVGVSVLFGYILKGDLIDLFPNGIINLHPGYLPFNRGAHPNVWSIIEGTPAGVTLHFVDEGIDTGDIIVRRKVKIEPTDTGKSLYKRLEKEGLKLFKETWPRFTRGNFEVFEQDENLATYHTASDIEKLDKIPRDSDLSPDELINWIRARTFPPNKSAYIEYEGKKIYLELNLKGENEDDGV